MVLALVHIHNHGVQFYSIFLVAIFYCMKIYLWEGMYISDIVKSVVDVAGDVRPNVLLDRW